MKYKVLALSITAAMFIGCGGGSSSDSSSTTDTQRGVFVDALVKGLNYETTSGIKGVTNSKGEYQYKQGDYVTFSVGKVDLGKTKAAHIVTPLDVSDNNWTKAANIAYVLQSLDTDGNNTDELIALPDETILRNILTDINLNDETNVTSVVSTVKSQIESKMNVSLPDINLTDANNTMVNYLKNYTITEEFGFGKYALKGKTFYLVHKYTGDEDLEKYGWVSDVKLKFEENKVYLENIGNYTTFDENESIYDYNVSGGILNMSNAIEGNLSVEVSDINGNIIKVKVNDNDTRYFVTNLNEAQKLAELLNMEEKKAWSAKFLDGRTLYDVEANNMYKLSFNNGRMYYYTVITAENWEDGVSTGYRIVDNNGNVADYGIIEANETEIGNPDGYQYYKIIKVDPLKGNFYCYDDDGKLEDIVEANEITSSFFTDYGEAMMQLQKKTKELFESIKNNYFGGINEDGTSFYVVGPDDNGKWIMATLFVYDYGQGNKVAFNDLSVNKYAEGNWSVSDDNKTLTFTLNTDYYNEGEDNPTESWTITGVGDGYFEINDGDYTDYLFLDKQKAEEFLNKKNSQ